jgi:hypothetical protein
MNVELTERGNDLIIEDKTVFRVFQFYFRIKALNNMSPAKRIPANTSSQRLLQSNEPAANATKDNEPSQSLLWAKYPDVELVPQSKKHPAGRQPLLFWWGSVTIGASMMRQ